MSQADPRPGNLLPVLDLETSQGLDQQGVTLWARRWVDEVRRLTGVTPIMYTSPYGWASRTGDSRALARDGRRCGWRTGAWSRRCSRRVGRERLARLAVHERRARRRHRGKGRPRRHPGETARADHDPEALARGHRRCRQGHEAPRTASDARRRASSNVDPGTVVTLTATPDDHAYFTGWTGACRRHRCRLHRHDARQPHRGASFVTDITSPTPTVDVANGFRGPVTVAIRRAGVQGRALQRAAPARRGCARGGRPRLPVDDRPHCGLRRTRALGRPVARRRRSCPAATTRWP